MRTTRQIFEEIARLQEIAENLEDRSAIDAQIDVLASLMTFEQATDKYGFRTRTAAHLAVALAAHGWP